MKVKGKITDLVHNDFNSGMVTIPRLGKVFFSPPDTTFSNIKFEELKIGDNVAVEYQETSRGLFASSLEKVSSISKNVNLSEASL